MQDNKTSWVKDWLLWLGIYALCMYFGPVCLLIFICLYITDLLYSK